ncbi:MAG: hypothetical protein HYY85_01945 [Deltaproteobacteria bacterium]|nr:hypothetical protein [Deltaproteobacteria bacterium]
MRNLVRLMLVAGLMATVAIPYTFISGRDAYAAQDVMAADDSGPLPAWWAQTVYGEHSTQPASTGIATGPARTATDVTSPRGPFGFSLEDSRYVNH